MIWLAESKTLKEFRFQEETVQRMRLQTQTIRRLAEKLNCVAEANRGSGGLQSSIPTARQEDTTALLVRPSTHRVAQSDLPLACMANERRDSPEEDANH